MKIYVKSDADNEINEITFTIYVDIIYKSSKDQQIAASINTNLVGQALTDFNNFIITAIGTIESLGYKCVDGEKSNRPDSISEYYVFVKTDTVNNKRTKCVVYFRASDHDLDNSPHAKIRRSHHFKREAQGSKNDAVQYDAYSWDIVEINIDDKSYNNYNDARAALKQKVMSLTFTDNFSEYK